MNEHVIEISIEHKHLDIFEINGIHITLPKYVKNSISNYRFVIIEEKIILQRKCNICGTFFDVQEYKNNNFINIENTEIKYIGEKSGFHNTCNECSKTPSPNNLDIPQNNSNNTVQLNIKIDIELKKYYQIRAIENNTSLKDEIIKVLNSERKK